MLDRMTLAYLFFVFIAGAVLIIWSRFRLHRTKILKRIRLGKLAGFESVKSSTPIDNPVQEARQAAVDNIEKRFSIIRKLSYYSIIVVWIVALVVPFLNVLPATVISILVAASGIIIGVAARPYIENLICGIVISLSQPIRIGDTVLIDEHYGTVEDINITHTVIKVWNWRRYLIPNSRMLSKELVNYTLNDAYQWVHVEFSVAYESDIELVEKLAKDAAVKSGYFAGHEAPSFWVMEMDERSIRCWLAAWADSPTDAWELKNDIRTNLIRMFGRHGIKTHRLEVDALGRA